MPPSDTAPTLDDETTAALTLFNEYVEADRERTQREKRIRKAERAKDEAAAQVKALDDKGVTGERKAEAEQAYRDALDKWKALRDGKEPPAPTPTETETEKAAADTESETESEKAETEPAGETAEAVTEPAEPTAEPDGDAGD